MFPKLNWLPPRGPESLQNIRRGGISALGSADLRTLHPVSDRRQHLASDGHAFGTCRFRGRSLRHPMEDFIRHGNPELVLHELSVSGTHQWPNSGHYGNSEVFNPSQKALQQSEVEYRLRYHVFRPRLHFVFEAFDLFVQVR